MQKRKKEKGAFWKEMKTFGKDSWLKSKMRDRVVLKPISIFLQAPPSRPKITRSLTTKKNWTKNVSYLYSKAPQKLAALIVSSFFK